MKPRSSAHDHRIGCPSIPAILLFLALAFIHHPCADAVSWQDDVTVSDYPMWSLTGPAVATDADARTHIVWSEQLGEDMGDQVFYRSGSGDDWSPVVQLSNSYGTSNPTIVVDLAGRIHVAWSDYDDGQEGIFYRRFESGAWTPAARLNDYNGRNAGHPRLAADPDGTVHLVWDQGDFYPPPVYAEIYYSHWDETTWTAQEPLTEGANIAVEPAMAVAANGDVHVLWQDNITGTDRVYHRERVEGVWSAATVIGSGSEPVRHPDIAVSPSGDVHAVMVRGQSTPRVCYSRLSGTGWLDPTALTSNQSDFPRIATSRCGDAHSDVHIVWQESGGAVSVITYMNIHGLSFGAPEPITGGTANAVHAAISVDPICNLDVAWQDNRESTFMQGVYYMQGIVSASGVDGFGPGRTAEIVCAPNPFDERATFRMPTGASGTVRIYDAAGRIVRSLEFVGGTGREIRWDGRNDAGEPLGPGVYFYRLDGTPEAGRVVRLR
jgi:hypothetical protein